MMNFFRHQRKAQELAWEGDSIYSEVVLHSDGAISIRSSGTIFARVVPPTIDHL